MGTQDYKADISEALKKFTHDNSGHPPGILVVNYRDAMDWHTHAGSTSMIQSFLDGEVKRYMDPILLRSSPLRCSVKLLDVEDQTPTHFVSKVEERWRFAFSHSNLPRTVVIFANEVFDDWNAEQILNRLEHHAWESVLGNNRGQRVLRYDNQGFSPVETNVA